MWMSFSGGEGGIRTHGDNKATTLFESAPINRSGTSPIRKQLSMNQGQLSIFRRSNKKPGPAGLEHLKQVSKLVAGGNRGVVDGDRRACQ